LFTAKIFLSANRTSADANYQLGAKFLGSSQVIRRLSHHIFDC